MYMCIHYIYVYACAAGCVLNDTFNEQPRTLGQRLRRPVESFCLRNVGRTRALLEPPGVSNNNIYINTLYLYMNIRIYIYIYTHMYTY